MKKLLCLLLLSSLFGLHSQTMNRFGHFIVTGDGALPCTFDPAKNRSNHGIFEFKGNTVYKVAVGYMSLDGGYENTQASVFLYDEKGLEIYSRKFSNTINLVLSPNKEFCAFYDGKIIHVLNLKTFADKTSVGSTVFAVDDDGNIAYYDEMKNAFIYKTLSYKVNGRINHVKFGSDGCLFSTSLDLFSVKESGAVKIFSAGMAKIFDLQINGSIINVSTKTLNKGGFIFEAYQSNNGGTFTKTQTEFYPIKKRNLSQTNSGGLNKGIQEMTANPLDYYATNPYHPVGNSYGEIQEYGGAPYPHPGVDLFGNYHDSVYAVRSGYIKAILTTSGFAHWRVATSNNNGFALSYGYLYAHLDAQTIPYQVGDSVQAGDVIALLVNFPVTGFIHCHFARIMDQGMTWSGSWWTLDNPLTFINGFGDATSPVFEKTINNHAFAFRNSAGAYLSPDSLFGNVRVISKVYDLVNSSWHVDVNKLRYNLSPLSTPLVKLLDIPVYEYDFYTDTYFNTTYSNLLIKSIYSRDNVCFSTGNYTTRDFFHIVTNTDGNDTITQSDSLSYFNTINIQNGSYIFRVEAWDASNNYSRDSMIIKIRNPLVTGVEPNENLNRTTIFPNPSQLGKYYVSLNKEGECLFEIYNGLGQKIRIGIVKDAGEIDLREEAPGIYYLHLNSSEIPDRIKLIKL